MRIGGPGRAARMQGRRAGCCGRASRSVPCGLLPGAGIIGTDQSQCGIAGQLEDTSTARHGGSGIRGARAETVWAGAGPGRQGKERARQGSPRDNVCGGAGGMGGAGRCAHWGQAVEDRQDRGDDEAKHRVLDAGADASHEAHEAEGPPGLVVGEEPAGWHVVGRGRVACFSAQPGLAGRRSRAGRCGSCKRRHLGMH